MDGGAHLRAKTLVFAKEKGGVKDVGTPVCEHARIRAMWNRKRGVETHLLAKMLVFT